TRDFRDQSNPKRSVERFIFGNCLKRKCLQSVAGENRGGFVELYVTGRAATTQFIIIHRRQVIMNQRIGVNHLQRAGGANQSLVTRAEGLADSEQQRGPEALATGKDTPANRCVHARWFVSLPGN